MKKLPIGLMLITSAITNTTISAEMNSGGIQEYGAISIKHEKWYRELRVQEWLNLGASEQRINDALTKIRSTNNDLEYYDKDVSPQTQTYTDAFMWQAKAAFDNKNYKEASILSLAASYPNLLTEKEIAALNFSVKAYLKRTDIADSLSYVEVKTAANKTVPGIVHLPAGKGPFPVVLFTGGIDKPLTNHALQASALAKRGIATITFDIPGAGLNKDQTLRAGTAAQSHDAFYQYALTNPLFDNSRIGALSQSGAGISFVEFMRNQPDLNVGVLRCGLVNDAIGSPEATADLIQHAPASLVASFLTRYNVIGLPLAEQVKIVHATSFSVQGFDKLSVNTPILAINTRDDFISPPQDLLDVALISAQGEVAFYGSEGHCPDQPEAWEKVYTFIDTNI